MSASASTTSSWRRSLTRMRVCATQAWPLFIRLADLQFPDRLADVGVVENDRRGLAAEFQAHPLELLAAQRGDAASDARLDPVNDDLVHPGMAHQRLADLACRREERTPPRRAGPSCSIISANHKASNGVSGAGLTMTVQPAISAGISLGMIRNCGTFHGTIAADHARPGRGAGALRRARRGGARPTGSRGRPPGVRWIIEAAAGGLAQSAEAARRAHLVGDQVGHLVEVAAVDRRQLLDLAHALLRVSRGHGPWSKACRAAATASSTSAGVAAGTSPIGLSVCGEMTVRRCSVDGLRHRPPMKSWS